MLGAHFLPRGLLLIAAGAALTACQGRTDEVVISFPDALSREATSVLAVTVIEPFLYSEDSELPELVRCSDIGVFPPSRRVDPDTINTAPNLGRVLSDVRESETYPIDGEWSVEFPEIKEDNETNPWGAVLVYVEARGEVRATQDQGGGQISATLLSGCYCVRTREGSHPNRALDQAVKTACSPVAASSDKAREVPLEAVLPDVFRLDACSVQALTAPENQTLSPGPTVCASTKRCDDVSTPGEACFRCMQPCRELDDLSNIPIVFTVDQPGGSTSPARQIVLADKAGQARGQITVDGCDAPIAVRAQVVGRADTAVDFTVECVEPVTEFGCDESELLPAKEPVALSRIPGPPGGRDALAILYDSGADATLEVTNPLDSGPSQILEFPASSARALRGFSYELGARPEDRARPALAVVISQQVGDQDRVLIYVYEWIDGQLVPHDGGALPGTPIVGDCERWVCETDMFELFDKGPACGDEEPECQSPSVDSTRLPPCMGTGEDCVCPAPTPPPACGCRLTVEFQTEVSINTADLDGDQRADLAVATSSDLPITIFYSSQAGGAGLYRPEGCACGRYAQAPTTFELVSFGGPGERPDAQRLDLVIGAPGGAFSRYGIPGSEGDDIIPCGQPARFGGLVPVRDLARGRFQCHPLLGPAGCNPFEDIVMVAAKTLGGGSFDDPGTIRVIYGDAVDLSARDDLFSIPGTSLELVARPLAGEEDPRDPRTAEVGDINADGHDDLAVLFGSSEEIHVWLGASNKGLGEVTNGINLEQCSGGRPPDSSCSPLHEFALADFDGDGALEVVVVCDPTSNARLRRYGPEVSGR